MVFIDGTVVNVALPALQSNLNANVADVQWVVESYTLFLAALLLLGGSLGDRFGRKKIFAIGVALFAAALALNPFFPIGKKLWTSSFVLLTVGIDLIVLAGLIAWIDLGRHKFGVRFFEIFGRNPIFIYIFAIILERAVNAIPAGQKNLWHWLGKSVIQPQLPGPPGSLLGAILFMLACWLMAWALDRKNIVIKV